MDIVHRNSPETISKKIPCLVGCPTAYPSGWVGQVMRRGAVRFRPARERVKLVRSLACVDAAIESIDQDG